MLLLKSFEVEQERNDYLNNSQWPSLFVERTGLFAEVSERGGSSKLRAYPLYHAVLDCLLFPSHMQIVHAFFEYL